MVQSAAVRGDALFPVCAGGGAGIGGGGAGIGGDGAGIGGSSGGYGGNITISGGTVEAIGYGGVGIGGGGHGGFGGNITISGGTVTATGKDGTGIGGTIGAFSTGTNGSAFITASSIADIDSQGSWQGVFFFGANRGQVYGSPTLTTDLTIPAGKELRIPEGTSLTIGEGATLSNNGIITNISGTFKVEGTLENDGTIMTNSAFVNNGTVNNKKSIFIYGPFANNGTLNNHGNLANYYTITNNGTINNIGGTIDNQKGQINNTNGIIISDSNIGGSITGNPVHAHQWEAEWSSNSTHHWHECPDCPLENSLKDGYDAHAFGEWTTDKEATADTAGSKSRTCNICQYTETQTIPATGGGSGGGDSSGGGGSSTPTYRPDVIRPSQGGSAAAVSPSRPERGLMSGYEDGRFGPNDTLSRAQLAQILFNREDRPVVNYLLDFSDVAGEAWYIEAIRWATSQGIVSGYGDGLFGPNDPITREQLAVMLWRYVGSPAATNMELNFNDESEISPFAREALRWAVENGILNGYGDGRLGPQGQASRAQTAQLLKNFIENQEE